MKNKNISLAQSKKNNSQDRLSSMLMDLILTKSSRSQYLEINTLLRIIKSLPVELKNDLLIGLRKISSSKVDLSKKIISLRILNELQPEQNYDLILNAIRKEKQVIELINVLLENIPEIVAEKGLYKYADRPDNDVYQHSLKRAGTLQFMLSLFSNSIFSTETDQDLEDLIIKEFELIKPDKEQQIPAKLDQVIDNLSKAKLLMIASFLLDVGKPVTATPEFLDKNTSEISEDNAFSLAFRDHEKAGAELVPVIARRLGLTEKQTTYIKNIVFYHRDIKKAVEYAYQYDHQQAKKILDTQLRSTKQLHANFNIHIEMAFLFLADNLEKHFFDDDRYSLIKHLQAFIQLINI